LDENERDRCPLEARPETCPVGRRLAISVDCTDFIINLSSFGVGIRLVQGWYAFARYPFKVFNWLWSFRAEFAETAPERWSSAYNTNMSYDPYASYEPYAGEGGTCQACFRGLLSIQHGVLVCDACGEASTAFLEETHEIPFYATTGTRLREQSQARGTQEIRRVAERQKTVTFEEVGHSVDAYVGLLRGLLVEGLRRVEARLVDSMGMQSIVEDVWWRWVLASEVLEEDGINGVVQVCDGIMCIDTAILGLICRSLNDARRQETNRSTGDRDERHVVFERYLTSRFPLRCIYAILLISCVVERHPIDAHDITTLFASTGALVARDMSLVEGNLASREYLCFDGVPSPVRVYMDMKELVMALGIVLPPLNVHGWLARYAESIGAQVMAGLYVGWMHVHSWSDGCGEKNETRNNQSGVSRRQLLPWTALASMPGFLGEVDAAESLVLPHNEQYVMEMVGRGRLRAYCKWFVDRVGEVEEGPFDFVLERMEQRALELEQRATPHPREVPRVRSLPWCYVRNGQRAEVGGLEKLVALNEEEAQTHLQTLESSDGSESQCT
jgi:hypothetical protein